MLNNLLFRLRQYVRDNRAKIVRAFIIAAGALLFALLIYCGAEYIAGVRYDRKINAIEAMERDASARALEAERQAELLKAAILAKYDQLRELETRAANAETALRNARGKVVTLREVYEKTRDNPDIPVDISCADLCARLANVNHPCEQ